MPFPELWTWLETRPLSEHIGFTWWFPFLESIHVLALTLVVGSILMVDLRLLGVAALRYAASRMNTELIPWTWGAFGLAVVTGFGMFMTRASAYIENPAFQTKLVLLLLAGANMALFQFRTYRGIAAWDTTAAPPVAARLAGAVSLLLWAGVVLAGRWIGHSIQYFDGATPRTPRGGLWGPIAPRRHRGRALSRAAAPALHPGPPTWTGLRPEPLAVACGAPSPHAGLLDGRSDTFSLGCVLYEAASGTRAFDGPSALAIMHAIVAADPPPPSAARPELPSEFDHLLQRALAKDREHRYDATELTDALRLLQPAVTGSTPGIAAPPEEPATSEPWHIVGREAELQHLDDALTQVIAQRGRTLLITGEPGIGKTTLADEFIRRAGRRPEALLVARGRCVEQYGTGETYLPFLDALGSLLKGTGGARVKAILRSHAPTWCLQLPAVFGSSDTHAQLERETIGATKDRMLRELGDALNALTASLPVLLLLEDLHWADAPSIDLLRHLCQRVGDQRLLIVGTLRPEDVDRRDHPLRGYTHELIGREQCEELALPMLGSHHIERYLDARFAPNDFASRLTGLIQRKTDGHPLFATLLIQWLLERGDIVRSPDGWTLQHAVSDEEVQAPQGVRSIIRTKLEALDEDDQRALQFASVEGEEFQSTVLAHLLDVDDLEIEERLARLDRGHRLVTTVAEEELPDGTLTTRYRFSHALYRDALYDEVVSQRRVRLHRRIGERLLEHYGDQASRIAATLAAHFERGRDFARAVDYLIQAGDKATHAYANAEAETQYSRALSLVDRLGPEVRAKTEVTIREKRGTTRHALSRFDDAVDDFTRMVELAAARDDDTASRFAGLTSLTRALFFSHRLDETAARAAEALAVAERSDNSAWQADIIALVGNQQLCYGELADAKQSLDHAIALARSAEHRSALGQALSWRAALHYWQSDYAAADDLLVEAVRHNADSRDGFQLLASLVLSGTGPRQSGADVGVADNAERGQRDGPAQRRRVLVAPAPELPRLDLP